MLKARISTLFLTTYWIVKSLHHPIFFFVAVPAIDTINIHNTDNLTIGEL
jgi:hypothetical protein